MRTKEKNNPKDIKVQTFSTLKSLNQKAKITKNNKQVRKQNKKLAEVLGIDWIGE